VANVDVDVDPDTDADNANDVMIDVGMVDQV
jgi:hypothetical protein